MTPGQAADLGVCLVQHAWRSVYLPYLAVLAPVALLCASTVEMAAWLPSILLWWSKPWLDRTVLFALSRAAFGNATTVSDLWQAQKSVWWSQWWRTWTLRRLSASRAFTQPVVQLEQQRGAALSKRILQLRRGMLGASRALTVIYANIETALVLSMAVLALMLMPGDSNPMAIIANWSQRSPVMFALCVTYLPYLLVIAFLEPFYVAAGFGMYLNRRVALEAWDLEQDLRHAFAH
jgi:hypothetical protein